MYLHYAVEPPPRASREKSKKKVLDRFGFLMDIEVLFLAHTLLSGLDWTL
jgi:hypothetical protein